MNRSPIATGLQFGALALSLMLLSVIWLVRSDLLSDWQRTVPVDAPNAFALNIAPMKKTPISMLLMTIMSKDRMRTLLSEVD